MKAVKLSRKRLVFGLAGTAALVAVASIGVA